jgi:hypothetical protein
MAALSPIDTAAAPQGAPVQMPTASDGTAAPTELALFLEKSATTTAQAKAGKKTGDS